MNKWLKGLLLFLFVLVLARGNLAFEATQQALQFWFNQLVPSLFVTMVLVSLCLDYQVFSGMHLLKPLAFFFHLNEGGITLFLSCLLLGAPSGAVLANQLVKEKRLHPEAAKRLISCVSLATPSFIVVTCGTVMLQKPMLGVMLWGIELACCALFMLVWHSPKIQLEPLEIHPRFFP